ncbi:hypothetical protein [uncultured Pseudodesulfovibrio sp.]|uniref:hypothetical protein n=1 Tax=uncultured Pseudodesulfovibrio sp. TaxID=2035858 RepID=UPI0029C9A0D5|nr:hypothetical protein [uncultured Pseudodesulfovibrio sp.]
MSILSGWTESFRLLVRAFFLGEESCSPWGWDVFFECWTYPGIEPHMPTRKYQ